MTDTLSTYELQEKMAYLRAATDAVYRAKVAGEWVSLEGGGGYFKYTTQQAANLAMRTRERDELRGTLPKLRVVH